MNSTAPTDRDLYLELLAGRALDDLSPPESDQLPVLASQFPDIDDDEMDRVVAAVEMALVSVDASGMPPGLRAAIEEDAGDYVGPRQDGGPPQESQAVVTPHAAPVGRSQIGMRESIAWFVATAALLLAMLGWLGRDATSVDADRNLALLRAGLMNSADTVQVAWKPGTTPFEQPVAGDVVWSDERQEGYMRFVGMPMNDPEVEQYQLWIIDPSRDDEPVDGGVFDISATGEVIVPIRAKLAVNDPAAFAITIEKPGGVVVSTQERLPLLAPAEA